MYIFQHVYCVKYCSSFHFHPQCKFHWLQWMAFRSVKKWQESILCRRWPTDWKWKVFNGLCRKTTICEDLRILVAKNKKDFRGSCIQGSGPLMNDSKTMSGRLRDFHCIKQSWRWYFSVEFYILCWDAVLLKRTMQCMSSKLFSDVTDEENMGKFTF